jgi:hypothetical protein
MGKKKSEDKAVAPEESAGKSFSGHIVSLRLNSGLHFEMRGKKGKRRSCVLEKTHPMFALAAETITHAYWVERKIVVEGSIASDSLAVQIIQVGDFAAPTLPEAISE